MSRFLFVANDRALDFVNTSYAGGDTLPDFNAFVEWLVAADCLSVAETRDVLASDAAVIRAFGRLREMRTAIRSLVDAYVGGQVPSASDLACVNAHLETTPTYEELVGDAFGFATKRHVLVGSPETFLFFPADAARALFTHKRASAIRRCAGEGCTHYFYDASKNGTRRWCSMAGCGNREKIAALRQRRRERFTSG